MRAIVLLFSLLSVAALSGCGSTNETAEQGEAAGLRVTVEPVTERTWEDAVVLRGVMESARPVRVTPEFDGAVVTHILVDVGETVTRGQALVGIDDDALEVAVHEARAARRAAEAAEAASETAYQRVKQVELVGGSSAQAVDDARARRDDARQQRLRAAAAERASILRRDGSGLVSPADGVVLTRSVEVGDRLGGTATPAFEIGETLAAQFTANASLEQVHALTSGQPAEVVATSSPGAVRGTVLDVAPGYGLSRVSSRVRIRLSGEGFPPGASAKATVATGRRSGLVVPASALVFRDQPFVWTVDAQRRVSRRPVVLGGRAPGGLVVLAGLAAGESIVRDAGPLLVEGERVRLAKSEADVAAERTLNSESGAKR
jgi:HlyD family secretion protein